MGMGKEKMGMGKEKKITLGWSNFKGQSRGLRKRRKPWECDFHIPTANGQKLWDGQQQQVP